MWKSWHQINWLLQSMGLSALDKMSWSNCSDTFFNVRFEFAISLYTFGYTGFILGSWTSSDGMSFIIAGSGWRCRYSQQRRVLCEA
jgi:hypothetical protein